MRGIMQKRLLDDRPVEMCIEGDRPVEIRIRKVCGVRNVTQESSERSLNDPSLSIQSLLNVVQRLQIKGVKEEGESKRLTCS